MPYLLLGLCGAIGAILRYLIGTLIISFQDSVFPFATITVNLIGCFILGLLTSQIDIKWKIATHYKTAIKTGLIGSFTTFSTFSVEVVQLLQEEYYIMAIMYIMISASLGFIFAGVGFNLGNRYARKEQVQ